MRLEDAAGPRRRPISLTPLIDVVFILLLFFMLASNFQQWRSMKLTASSKSAASPSDAKALVLKVAADGTLELDGRPLASAELAAVLAPHLRRDPAQSVVVRPADALPLQTLVNTFDRLAAAGVTKSALGRSLP